MHQLGEDLTDCALYCKSQLIIAIVALLKCSFLKATCQELKFLEAYWAVIILGVCGKRIVHSFKK